MDSKGGKLELRKQDVRLMGFTKYLRQNWGSEEQTELMRSRMISWRKEGTVKRIERPTRLDRAHALGWKAKQGFFIVRVRIGKGTSKREKPSGGRKPSKAGMTSMNPKRSLQAIAEGRVGRKFPNAEVLNSYYVAEDGKQKWFEVILLDRAHPAVLSDRTVSWVANVRGRAERGLTSAGKKSRGL